MLAEVMHLSGDSDVTSYNRQLALPDCESKVTTIVDLRVGTMTDLGRLPLQRKFLSPLYIFDAGMKIMNILLRTHALFVPGGGDVELQ